MVAAVTKREPAGVLVERETLVPRGPGQRNYHLRGRTLMETMRFFATFVLSVIVFPVFGYAEAVVELYDYSRQTIYHSPETPGYTCWVKLWQKPDSRLQCKFVQYTGPVGNPDISFPVLESTDGGGTWNRVTGDVPTGTANSIIVLGDGTYIRTMWNSDPASAGYTQRSTDGGQSWEAAVYLLPPADYRTWPTIIHSLRDGRLVMMAGVWARTGPQPPLENMEKKMFVSTDQGESWGAPILLMPLSVGGSEESDFCELLNGDLFWVHRVMYYGSAETLPPGGVWILDEYGNHIGYQVRMQSLVVKNGEGWVPQTAVYTPFEHSGFPAVLRTKEGLILHFATDGVYWTANEGNTWTKFVLPAPDRTDYYPRVVQIPDGRIVCLSHVGGDDTYGSHPDQSITQQRFRVRVVGDIGLRIGNTAIAISPTANVSPLKIAKNGTTYEILLVDPSSSSASGVRIQTGSGIKALKKLFYEEIMFSDGFESGNFTAGGWTNSGCDIQTTYKYSGTYAAEFNSSDSLTKSLSTAGYSNIEVQYARYTRQMETDDHFISEWYNGSAWTTLEDLTGDSAWTVKIYSLPSGANNNPDFQIRFRTSSGSTDYAYLDDVKIIGDAYR